MLQLRSMYWAALVSAVLFQTPLAAAATQTVPFVGCPSDGQQGPIAAPKGQPKAFEMDQAAANALAWYKAQYSEGVLAPRGWRCFSFYGSSGTTLAIAPTGKLDDQGQAIAGPAVVLTEDYGGTSGRFAVAKIAARIFAQPEKSFIDKVIAEGIEPRANFPSGPYSSDSLSYKTPTLVEFATPAGKDGLGTADRLAAGATSILGVAKLVNSADGPNLFLLSVRMPAAHANLAATVVNAAEATLRKLTQ